MLHSSSAQNGKFPAERDLWCARSGDFIVCVHVCVCVCVCVCACVHACVHVHVLYMCACTEVGDSKPD